MRLTVITPILLAVCLPAFPSTVTIAYSGSLTSSGIPGIAANATFSGSFTYMTTFSQIATGGTATDFALPSGDSTLTIGGNTLTNDNGLSGFVDFVEVTSFGQLEIGANHAAGSGPVAGGQFYIFFAGSSNPAFSKGQLPFPFPIDFTSTSVVINDANFDLAVGVLTDIRVTNHPDAPVPELPTTWLVAPILGTALLRLTRSRGAGF